MAEKIDWGFGDWVDVVVAVQTRGWRIACNPKDRAEAAASLEQVAEHERWTLDEPPQLELHDMVPRFRVGFFDVKTRQLTGLMSKVTNSKKGLARLEKVWLPGRAEMN